MTLTKIVVSRSVVAPRIDSYGEEHAAIVKVLIALARCAVCKKRIRVLPCDVLPRKRYSVQVIERLVEEYDQNKKGLRKVVDGLPGDAPAHTTLHAWTDGIGAWFLGRPGGEVPSALPAARVMEAIRIRRSGVSKIERSASSRIDPDRYQSEERRIRLEALRKFVTVIAYFGGLPWICKQILVWLKSSPIGFKTGHLVPPIERVGPPDRRESLPSTDRKDKRCKTRGRSPPGDSNRSPHS